MKNIHKLLFIFIIFTVLLVPSYSVKADDNKGGHYYVAEDVIKMLSMYGKKVRQGEMTYNDALNEIRKTADYKGILEELNNNSESADFVVSTVLLYFINLKDTPDGEIVNDCQGIFGNVNNESSTAYMIQKILNYIKVLAPLLVVVLSGFDFAKNTLIGDQDEMKKATKKLGIRLACAVGVYLAPLITWFIINFINNSSVDQSCNIK